MERKSKWYFGRGALLSLLVCMVFLIAFYVWEARTWVADLYAGKASEWLTNLVGWIYPRFFVEKHRFTLDFFLQKADQVVCRFSIAILACLLFRWASTYFTNPEQTSSADISVHTWRLFRWYFAVLACFFSWDWYFELANLYEARFFYQPVFLLRVLYLPFPTPQASFLLCVLLWLSAFVVAFGGKRSVYAAILFAVLFVLLQGYQLSFHKIDHTFALFTYWACLMPFLCAERVDKRYFFLILRLALALPYTIAGIEKITISGLAWFEPYTLQTYLRLHGQSWGLWVAQFSVLCTVSGVLILFFEVFFVSVVFFRWARFIFLPLGIFFHLATYMFMNIGALIHPWWLCYGIFCLGTRKK